MEKNDSIMESILWEQNERYMWISEKLKKWPVTAKKLLRNTTRDDSILSWVGYTKTIHEKKVAVRMEKAGLLIRTDDDKSKYLLRGSAVEAKDVLTWMENVTSAGIS